jgi:c-di-GMP-binding flagellar brake protein YcgR
MRVDSSKKVRPPLSVGERVEVGINLHGDEPQWLPTRIEDEDGSGLRLTVAWPTDRRELVYIRLGETIDLAASLPGDALYSTQVKIAAARQANVPLLDLEVQGEWKRLQRRQAVRVNVGIRPRLMEKVTPVARKPLRASITNISATGVQVQVPEELYVGDRIALAFQLRENAPELSLEGDVRRVEVLEQGSMRVWRPGCQFVDVQPAQSEQIIQFIFAQQRVLARSRR